MINFPSNNRQWIQTNASDLQGNLFVTKHIDFDESGYLKLSSASRAAYSEKDNDQFDRCSYLYPDTGNGLIAGTWDEPFAISQDILRVTPSQITETDHPDGEPEADSVWFGGKLVVADDTNVVYRESTAGGAWTDTNISLTDGSQHPIKVFISQSGFAIADANTVKLYTTISATPTLAKTLTFNPDYDATCMVYFNQNLYIGTKHKYGAKAAMFVWNGTTTAAQSVYEIDSHRIHDICVFDNSVVLISSSGALLRFSGSGFNFLAGFPIFYTLDTITDVDNVQLYHNVMVSNEDVLYISYAGGQGQTVYLNQPAGIWCYDPQIGLYHKYSFTQSTVVRGNVIIGAIGDIDTTTNEVTLASSIVPLTGTELIYTATTVVSPLLANTVYYVIKVSGTKFKLATTKANAVAGTAIDLTGTASGYHYFTFAPEIDYGAFITGRSAALCLLNRGDNVYGTDVAWSADLNNRSNSTTYGVLGTQSEALITRGYFITPKIFSTNTTDLFNNLSIKFAPLEVDDKILIKYRTTDDNLNKINQQSTNWNITWTSSTTFTTTYSAWSEAKVGDEVEILSQAGAGMLAHISTISVNTGTYTVTIDETFDQYTSGDIAKAIFRNWTKFLTLTSADTDGYKELLLGTNGKFIQFKVELRGRRVKIEDLKIDNQTLLPVHK